MTNTQIDTDKFKDKINNIQPGNIAQYEFTTWHLRIHKSEKSQVSLIICLFEHNKPLTTALTNLLKKYDRFSYISTDIKSIQQQSVEDSFAEKGIFITLTNQKYIEQFSYFVTDLANVYTNLQPKVRDTDIVLKFMTKRLGNWYELFKANKLPRPMNRKVLVGLFGELLVFEKIAKIKDFNMVENSWQANSLGEASSQDFDFENLYIEIKTTESIDKKPRIHGLRQLNPKESKSLYLCFIRIKEDKNNGISIRDLIHNCHYISDNNNSEHQGFLVKLLKGGYNDNDKNRLFDLKFSVISMDFYVVNESFPRLPNTDFPSSVIEVSDYTLDLKGLENYIVDFNDVLDEL